MFGVRPLWPAKIARQDFGDDALRCREISGGQICRHVDIDDTIGNPRGVSRILGRLYVSYRDFSK